MAAVVLSFLLASSISQYVERTIASRIDTIVRNALPGVQLLAEARGSLRHLDLEIDRFVEAAESQRSAIGSRLIKERRALDGALASYESLPLFPNEGELFAPVHGLLPAIDHAVEQLIAHGPDGAVVSALQDKLDELDSVIENVVQFNTRTGRDLGLSIAKSRSESQGIVWLLDGLSAILAIGATVLVIRHVRLGMRALEDLRGVAEQRASELSTKVDELGHFAGRVAHDLLSPLSTAMVSLEIARLSCEQAPAATRATQRGMAAVKRVQLLVHDLLGFARSGGQPDPHARTELGPVVLDVCDELVGQATTERIELVVAPLPAGEVACSGGVLTSLLANLIRNAIRYMGDAAERRIDVRVCELSARWRFEVEDTGPGIPPGEEMRIFLPYVQLGRSTGGLGLGLATVSRLVHAHGGEVGVVAPPGRGCTFWFELPKPGGALVSAASARPSSSRAHRSVSST